MAKRKSSNFTVERRQSGPTPERLAKAGEHFVVGDDKQGGRIYQFHDSSLDRLYSRLTKAAKTIAAEEQLRKEYIGLQRYKHHWHHAGLQEAIGTVDLNRVFASDPGSMSGMAKTEKQAHHRHQWRRARERLGWKEGIVVDNFVCAGWGLDVAGVTLGYVSPYRTRVAAEKVIRESGALLANMWGVG
jgi:hypothetical protein